MPTKFIQRGITRYDRDETLSNGYLIRVTRDGVTHGKYFSDVKFKGKRKALTAAKKAYDELVAELPPVKTTKGMKTSRNQSGCVGVHLAQSTSVYGEVYGSYCASWKSTDGQRKKITFSFKKYGKAASFKLAKLAREKECADRKKIEKLYEKQSGKKLKCNR